MSRAGAVHAANVCQGDIFAELKPGTTDILWQCPLCGDNGVIRGWEDTLWNRRPGFDAKEAIGSMRHQDFIIGETFWTATGPYRCTDIGTRTIVAIRLGPRAIVQRESGGGEEPIDTTVIVDDPSWLTGPPYAVAEMVFDENDLAGCYRTEAETRAASQDD